MAKKIDKKDTTLSIKEYALTLAKIKKQVYAAQLNTILSANKQLIKLYWFIGHVIAEKQEQSGWGSNVIEKLALDLQNEFPGIAGFSRTNIFRIRAFYLAYEKVPQAVGQLEELPFFNIPWGHNGVILEKIKDEMQRIWYAQKTIENGWSRSVLESYIKSDLYRREGKAVTNFKTTLLDPHSVMAQQSFKDPYVFDFLTLEREHLEHDLEQGLIDNVQKLLLEMGKGFALVGRQYHLQVSDHDYYIDLLFYNFKLKCFVVVELKSRPFDPRDAGQINFYLSAVDDFLKHADDAPTIGLILCKTKDNIVAEYALRGVNRPIGVASYEAEIVSKLPKELKGKLPTVAEIEAEFEKNEIVSRELASKAAVKRKKNHST